MKLMKKLPLFFMICFVCCTALLVPFGGGEASAATDDPPTSIDETNALDDLEGSILNGKEFNIEDWGFNERRSPEIVSFVEYGYSVYASRQDDYGLYVYIYNPQGVAFDTDTDRNKIELQAGNTEITRYSMTFLNYSDRPGTEGMFYKFKISLTQTRRAEILSGLTQSAPRAYRITQVELSLKGELKMIKCVTTYTYTGFAQGYGSELAAEESTLACKTDGFEDYAELEVHQTVYRTQGDFYDGEQSQLNSCYFRVPEKYYENYGVLSKIVCDWYEYVTKPILLTSDRELYTFFNNLQGEDVPSFKDGTAYVMWCVTQVDTCLWGAGRSDEGYTLTNLEELEGDYYVGFLGLGAHFGANKFGSNVGDQTNPFSAVFYVPGGAPATEYGITADELEKRLKSMSNHLGAPYLGGNFSEALFSDDVLSDRTRGYNHREIEPDDPVKLFTNYTVKDAYQKFFGGYTVSTEWETLDAFHEVTAEDLIGSDAEISARLYIGQNDVADLKAEFAKAIKGDERVVLLRYGDSSYTSIPFRSAVTNSNDFEPDEVDDEIIHEIMWEFNDDEPYDGYIAQETVYLDFKIISLNFLKNGVETVIPVVMTPQNVFSPITPPLDVNPTFNEGVPWWVWLVLACIVVIIIVVLLIFFPELRPIFQVALKILVCIILAPFYLIGWIIKAITNAVKRRQEAKAAAPPKTKAPKEPAAKASKEPGKGTGTGQPEQHIVLEVRRQASKASKTKTKAPEKAPGKAPKKAPGKAPGKAPAAKSVTASQKTQKSKKQGGKHEKESHAKRPHVGS